MIPDELTAALINYRDKRTHPGQFLAAVLSNDLQAAVLLATDESAACLRELVRWVANNLPAFAFGSRFKFDAWVDGATMMIAP